MNLTILLARKGQQKIRGGGRANQISSYLRLFSYAASLFFLNKNFTMLICHNITLITGGGLRIEFQINYPLRLPFSSFFFIKFA